MRRPLKMDTPENVRKSLEKIAVMVYRGEMIPQQANCLAIIANAILQSIRLDVQEAKITELEQLIEDQSKNGGIR